MIQPKPLLLLLSLFAVLFATPPLDKQVQFIAGVVLLQSEYSVTNEKKAQKYGELQQLTGITGADARELLTSYRDRHDDWKSMYDQVAKLLESAQSPAKPVQPPVITKKQLLKDAFKKIEVQHH